MKILSEKMSLKKVLEDIRGKTVCIVSAFASGTEDDVDLLIKNNKRVSLVVGTINSYSSPLFMRHCAKKKLKEFDFSVDFRAEKSTHWKLYLVSPKTVIVGSANYTKLGLTLYRDTCLKIDDQKLYDEYLGKYMQLQKKNLVVNSKDKRFNGLLEKYSAIHREQQRSIGRTTANLSADAWIKSEVNQTIPIFIWSDNHTKETREMAEKLIEQETRDISRNKIREFFRYEAPQGELPYSEGMSS